MQRSQYEYGNKVSIVSTKDTNIIVGVVSHDKNIHDSKTLDSAIAHANSNRIKSIKQAVCDRGYVGAKEVLGAKIILPKKALKKDNRYQRDKKRKLCKRRAAIEPIIGHLKSDFRLSRNLLKGQIGDEINVLMAACAWNLKKWLVMADIFLFLQKMRYFFIKNDWFFVVMGKGLKLNRI
ncbi:Mobile element protein [uncultured Candidatus Thioglobus sp.]|nr:Mobile element protein [uncultured Candidatus Thioglobus sp.]